MVTTLITKRVLHLHPFPHHRVIIFVYYFSECAHSIIKDLLLGSNCLSLQPDIVVLSTFFFWNLLMQIMNTRFQVMIFFSAHGVPLAYVEEAGDPYKAEMEECVDLIMEELEKRRILNPYTLAYQVVHFMLYHICTRQIILSSMPSVILLLSHQVEVELTSSSI